MSTNATISVKMPDGKIKSIYNHWDGYPKYLGRILLDNYNAQDKAETLVSLGDASIICKSIKCPFGHSFDNHVDGFSIFYGRDRGDRDALAEITSRADRIPYTEYYHYHWNAKCWELRIKGKKKQKLSIVMKMFSKL